jgi:D-sedoheptulose 7-phosphate isomerase
LKKYIDAQIEEAKRRGLICIGLTGNRGGSMHKLCDYLLEVPAADTPKMQEGRGLFCVA